MAIHRRGYTVVNGKEVGGDEYYYRFTYKGKDFCEGGFRTWAQVEEAERLAKNKAIAQILHPEDYAGEMTFRQAGEWWLKEYAAGKSSGRIDRGRLPILMDYFDKKLLREIQPQDIDTFLSKISDLRMAIDVTRNRKPKKMKDHTKNHYLALFRAIYERLKKKRMYKGENPAEFVDKIEVPTARCRFMYPSEEKLVTPAVMAVPDIFSYYRVGIETGMRIGEMQAIRVKHVDLNLRHIFVGSPESKAKNRKSRYVPIDDTLTAFLAVIMAHKGAEDYVLPHWSYNYIRRHFLEICKGVGITNLNIHDLRHTYAYNMLSQGAPLYKVSQLMGHSSLDVTQKHYGHLAAKDLRDAMESVKPFLSCNRFATAEEIYASSVKETDIKDNTI